MNLLDEKSQNILTDLNFFSADFIIPEDYVIIFNSADIAFIWKTIEQNLEVDPTQSYLIVKDIKDKIYYIINDEIYDIGIKFLIQLGIIEEQDKNVFKVNLNKFIELADYYLKSYKAWFYKHKKEEQENADEQ